MQQRNLSLRKGDAISLCLAIAVVLSHWPRPFLALFHVPLVGSPFGFVRLTAAVTCQRPRITCNFIFVHVLHGYHD